MSIKIFISHQSSDTYIATAISTRLKAYHSIDSYLDVIDLTIPKGEDLALHLQVEMSKCTHLIAVVSEATRGSWWVPWEIGIATEKELPLATYSQGGVLPPEYLRKWPYLMSSDDLDKYALVAKSSYVSFVEKSASMNEGVARIRSTREFFTTLRKNLGQA